MAWLIALLTRTGYNVISATSGDYYFGGTWIITANSVSTPTDGMIEATFSATLTGALTRGTV